MISFNIELNSKPLTGKKEHNLLLRITVNRKHVRLGLMYSISPNHFNPKGKQGKYIRASHPDHTRINSHIDDKIKRAKDVLTELENEGKLINAATIKAKMLESKTHDFLTFVENDIKVFEKNGNIGTCKKYRSVINSIKDFVQTETLSFEEIDTSFLNRYQAHLKENEKKQTTIHGYLSKVRSIFNKAIRQGHLEVGDNPFATYKIKDGTPNKERLNMNEILKIEELDYKENSLIWHVRNVFLFSFYNAGIRISDILLMTWDSVQDGRLVYTMFKTNKDHSVKLKEKPLAILEKYKGKEESFIFPFLSDRFDYSDPMYLHSRIGAKTALINKYLKDIAKDAKITKKITTHTARHSFADIARQKTDNIYNLSKTLGHSSIKVTEAYLASFDQKAVDDTMDSMFK
jgi:integrase/recombinase XerD